MAITPPISPISNCFWDTADSTKLLKAGDLEASNGDTLTKWVSNDGSRTLTAVGSPILRLRAYTSHPVIEFDGASGFYLDDGTWPLDNQDTGLILAGFKNTAGSGSGLPFAFASVCNTATTSRQTVWGILRNAEPSGLAMMIHGGSIDSYTTANSASQFGAFTRAIISSNDTEYNYGGSNGNGYGVTGTNDGLWVPYDASFKKARIAIGYEAISTPRGYWQGDIAYCGWWAEYDDASRAELTAWIESEYPTTSVILFGDSRFNTTINDEIAAAVNCNCDEQATGGHTIAQVEAAIAAYYAANTKIKFGFAVVHCGVNDAVATATLASMQSALVSLIATLKTYHTGKIILTNETPCKGNVSVTDAEAAVHRQYSDWITAKNWGSQVQVVDTYRPLSDPDQQNTLLAAYTTDNLHYSAAGNTRFTQVLTDAIFNHNVSGWAGQGMARSVVA